MNTFVRTGTFPVTVDELFAWHTRAGALERLIPPFERVRVLSRAGDLRAGHVELAVGPPPFALRWRARHQDYVEGQRFRDVQQRGPFARFEHTHTCQPSGPARAQLEDRIEYALPGGALAAWLGDGLVQRRLERVFAFRHARLAHDLRDHAPCRADSPRSLAVTGASGLLGRALLPYLSTGGHRVLPAGRSPVPPGALGWHTEQARLVGDWNGLDAVVHLAGENVGAGRWTAARKQRIRASRIPATHNLASALARLRQPPRVLVCASAIGIYGERGDELLTEASAPGRGFLAEVVEQWEAALEPARQAGLRVVHLRFGIVLTPHGGALQGLLPVFGLGLGGPVGAGTQWMSWVSLDDALAAVHHALVDEALSGVVNVVAPEAVTNRAFTRVLAGALRRPAWLPVPAGVVRAALGEMGEALLLTSTRVAPARLKAAGFVFRQPTLAGALYELLGRAPG